MPIVILAFLFFLTGCKSPAESQFNKFVNQQTIPSALQQGQLTRCIQCPLYFVFDSNNTLEQQIIQQHQLSPEQQLPLVIQRMMPRIQAQSDWWPQQFSAQAKFYWFYRYPIILGNEPAFRILIQDGKRSFFISSGDYHPKYFKQNATTEVPLATDNPDPVNDYNR